MKASFIIATLKFIYRHGGRQALKDLIDNPNKEYDEKIINLLDELLGYPN